MEDVSNKLEVTIEDGTTVTVNVLDFVDFTIENNETFIFKLQKQLNAKKMQELAADKTWQEKINKANSYSLDTITDQKELDFINNEIDRVVSELSEEGE